MNTKSFCLYNTHNVLLSKDVNLQFQRQMYMYKDIEIIRRQR